MSIDNRIATIVAQNAPTPVLDLWKNRIESIFGIVNAGETDHREVAVDPPKSLCESMLAV